MKAISSAFVLLFNIIEFFDRLFRHAPRPSVPQAEAPTEIFEEDSKEVVRDLTEDAPPAEPAPELPPRQESEIVAPNGICLRKSVYYRTRAGCLLSAKVMGYSWEDDRHFLVLSRNGGPLFKRRLC